MADWRTWAERRAEASYRRRVRAREQRKRRCHLDAGYAAMCSLRSRLGKFVAGRRAGSIASLVGCTHEELKSHLESRFLPGMSWLNRRKWHIDHIRPCASFDLTDPLQQAECFHYTNLQPLWAADNIAKSDSFPASDEYLQLLSR